MPETITPPKILSPCGCELTLDQARTVAGRLNNALIRNRAGGRKPECHCGECPACKQREYRARRAAMAK